MRSTIEGVFIQGDTEEDLDYKDDADFEADNIVHSVCGIVDHLICKEYPYLTVKDLVGTKFKITLELEE